MTTDSVSEEELFYPSDSLGLEAEEMRRLGYRVVDMVVDRLAHKNREAAILTGDAAWLRQTLGGSLPERPLDAEASLALLAEVALSHQQRGDHPRYFARVPGPSSFAAVLGDWLGTGFNTIAASWAGGSGPATIELVVIDWLRQLMGLPEGFEGVLVSGGSMASLTAFAAARAALGTGVVYLSDQTHSSLPRGLKALGFPPEHIRILESDAELKLPVASLLAAIAEDKQVGNRPFMVVATAGTTNAGTVDPLPELADICARENLWFHIDGAYGAPAVLTERGRNYLRGMERADSLVLDPHKWLFQPYDAGCLLIRKGVLEHCFNMNPEYLKDAQAGAGEVDFRNRGLELTRRSRALKLWLSLRTYGVARFREAIDAGIALAEYAECYLRQQPDKWEVVTPAQIGVICFALRQESGEGHKRRVQALADSGFACVSSTSLKGRTVFRLCIINPLTTESDIRETIERLGH